MPWIFLDKILKIQGVNYYWKKDEFPDWKFTDKKQIGFIVQDLEKKFPELVNTDNDSSAYKSVDYSKLTPVLVEGIKELNAKIEALQEQINLLKAANGNKDDEMNKLRMDNAVMKVEIEKIKK